MDLHVPRDGGPMDAPAPLTQARHRIGLTQAALATAAGASLPTLAILETGATSGSVPTSDRTIRSAGGRNHAAPDVDLLVDVNDARHGVLPGVGSAQGFSAIVEGDLDSPTTELLLDEVTSPCIIRIPARARPPFATCAHPQARVVLTRLRMSYRLIPGRHSAPWPCRP